MVSVAVTVDADAILAQVGDMAARQVPFALARSLTDTAMQARDALKDHTRAVFDRPKPWTVNAFRVIAATKTAMASSVAQKDVNASREYLGREMVGGVRGAQAWETRIRASIPAQKRAGKLVRGVLPRAGERYAMPGRGAKLDRYGNWSRGEMNRVLSYLKAHTWDANANITDRSKKRNKAWRRGNAYFLPKTGRLPRGIYLRRGRSRDILPILIFTSDRPDYSQRFRPAEVARRIADERFEINLQHRLADALAGY